MKRNILIVILFLVMLLNGCGSRNNMITEKKLYFDQVKKTEPIDLLVLGDSIGYGSGGSFAWTKGVEEEIEKTFGCNINRYNLASGGTTSYHGIYTLLSNKRDYDLVILCFGENDDADDFGYNYEKLIRSVITLSPEASIIAVLESSQHEYTQKIETIIKLCEHYQIPTVDTIKAFNECDYTDAELSLDGTHPTDLGYTLYIDETVKVLKNLECQNHSEPVKPVYENQTDFTGYEIYTLEDMIKNAENEYQMCVENPINGSIGLIYGAGTEVNNFRLIVDNQETMIQANIIGYSRTKAEEVIPGGTEIKDVLLRFDNALDAETFVAMIIFEE